MSSVGNVTSLVHLLAENLTLVRIDLPCTLSQCVLGAVPRHAARTQELLNYIAPLILQCLGVEFCTVYTRVASQWPSCSRLDRGSGLRSSHCFSLVDNRRGRRPHAWQRSNSSSVLSGIS